MKPRPRASAFIIRDGRLLTIHRFFGGREYYVLPGGGLKKGESFAAACRREVLEETGLPVVDLEWVWEMDNMGNDEQYFLVRVGPGEARLGGPEARKAGPENQYRLEWLAPEAVQAVNLLPQELKPVCRELFERVSQ